MKDGESIMHDPYEKPEMSLRQDPREKNGYHQSFIKKGVLGEVSKIEEEYAEFQDAVLQDAQILQLCELSDMLGAIEAYSLAKFHINLEQLIKMTRLTNRAFQTGKRI